MIIDLGNLLFVWGHESIFSSKNGLRTLMGAEEELLDQSAQTDFTRNIESGPQTKSMFPKSMLIKVSIKPLTSDVC